MKQHVRKMTALMILMLMTTTVFGQRPSSKAKVTGGSTGNPFAGHALWVNPYSDVAGWVRGHEKSKDPTTREQAQLIKKYIVPGPQTPWYGDWNSNVHEDVLGWLNQIKKINATAKQPIRPVAVIYNLPLRDAGGKYSQGGEKTPDGYQRFVANIAKAVTDSGIDEKPVFIIEPDSLGHMRSLETSEQEERLRLLRLAHDTLRKAGCFTYQDATHPNWLRPDTAAYLLRQLGPEHFNGIAVNVSNFCTNERCVAYGMALCEKLGPKHGIVIDCGRNGNGPPPDGVEPFNPPGVALGDFPTTAAYKDQRGRMNPRVHARIWVKGPAGSDGEHHPGDPAAGQVFPRYAAELIQNRLNSRRKDAK